MTLSKIEYLILYAALEHCKTLKNIASDWQLPHTELAIAANHLFQNGYILAKLFTEKGEDINNVTLTMTQIQAHLNEKLPAIYYLTPQGGAKWEAVSNPDWNRFYKGRFGSKYDIETGLSEAEVISPSPELIENYLKVSGHLDGLVHIPETVIWSEIQPWQATYWKTLPKAYKVHYKYRSIKRSIDINDPQEWELDKQIKKMFAKMQRWYKEPEFETTPPNPNDYTELNYYTRPNEISLQKAEYLILEFAVIFQTYSLGSVAYSKELSQIEVVIAADTLFQKGEIRAKVFADEYDFEGTPDVILTKTGIKDHLDGRIRASYYLTPSGGARWEEIAHPDWNKFFIVNFLSMFPYENGIFAAQQETIEKLLALDKFILMRQHIPGTESYEILEPWQVTYWKTLPRGYHLHCECKKNEWGYWSLNDDSPTELKESYEQATQWYEKARKWYINPFTDNA
jgi:hypothetical protein